MNTSIATDHGLVRHSADVGLLAIRRLLDDFCDEQDLPIDHPAALEAASLLIKWLELHHQPPQHFLESELKKWFADRSERGLEASTTPRL
jgi:hypothetical protein